MASDARNRSRQLLRAPPPVRQVTDPRVASARDRFESFARSVRDALAQRWICTAQTCERENPKLVYYLSMEFLIGRPLANNVTNLLDGAGAPERPDLLDWVEQEPDPGLGNGGLGRLAARSASPGYSWISLERRISGRRVAHGA